MSKALKSVKITSKAIKELLRSKELEDDLLRRGNAIAGAAGPGFVAKVSTGSKTRARVNITAETREAWIAQKKTHALERAIGAGAQ